MVKTEKAAETPVKALKGAEKNKAVNAIIRVFIRLCSPSIRALASAAVSGEDTGAAVNAITAEVKRITKAIPSPLGGLDALPEELAQATRGHLSEEETKYILELKNKHDASIAQVSMERALNHTVVYHLYKAKGLVTARVEGGAEKPAAEKKPRAPKAPKAPKAEKPAAAEKKTPAKPKAEKKTSGRAKKAAKAPAAEKPAAEEKPAASETKTTAPAEEKKDW